MSYEVKEIFSTIQGEGVNAGLPAVFCRFAGCNLWSGREVDRADATCRFCDTDFRGTDGPGGGRYAHAEHLADAVQECWRKAASVDAAQTSDPHRFVVLTGGEPALQCDDALIGALHDRAFRAAIETNGTRRLPNGLDWICVSPKAGTTLVVRSGQELKLVFPQTGINVRDLEGLDFEHFLLQPMDGPDQARNLSMAVAFCRKHPRWRLSLQTHKYIGIP